MTTHFGETWQEWERHALETRLHEMQAERLEYEYELARVKQFASEAMRRADALAHRLPGLPPTQRDEAARKLADIYAAISDLEMKAVNPRLLEKDL